MPALRRLAAPLVAALALSCERRAGPAVADAGDDDGSIASSQAPPLMTAPAPALPPPAPEVPSITCPREMVAIEGRFCVDRWEASLIDKATGKTLSPYYPPDRKLAAQLADTWEKERLEIGSDAAREVPIPNLPAWQREREVEPVAVSRPNVVPSGYLSAIVAARACENAKKRLCRHDEWVKACEGAEKRPFPYGNEYRQGACNIFRAMHPAMELHDNASVGHHDPRLNLVKDGSGDPLLRRTGATRTCKSVWGDDAVWDMNGNLDEWVEDEKGRFDGGFFSRSKKDGCASTITAHVKAYFDYSTGTRCCWSPGD
jgi:hypothetical protein